MYIEDEHTELKSILTKEIKKEIIAFANSDGGIIYVGIDDDGKVIGVKDIKSDIESLSCMIRDGIKSDLTLYTKIEQRKIEEKDVIVLSVLSAPNKPYYLADKGMKSSGVFIRHGSTSSPASDELIKKIIADGQNESFEKMISINQNLHFKYLIKEFEERGIKLDKEKFVSLNLLNLNDQYTNLGLLFSDECPYSIKCAIFEGKNDIKFKDRKEFTGSILEQVNTVYDYFNIYNKISSDIIGLERIDHRDYPEYALRESILNAVIHRDYNYTGSILASLYDDHFELTSLGGLIKGLKIEDLYLGISQTRNPNIANIFYRLKYVESFGTGIKRIMSTYENSDKKPIFISSENAFKTVLFNLNYTDPATNISYAADQNEIKIIEYLKNNEQISRQKVEEILQISKTKAIDVINELLSKKQVIQIGKGRSTAYMLNKK